MTISQAVAALIREKQEGLTSRFPCRAIMVKNIRQYCQLLSELQGIPDIVQVSADELFSSADVMPRYINLSAPRYADQWLILTGVSEYLRLFSRSEAENRRFHALWSHQAPASSRGRIIVPLWGCEAQWHDRALHLGEDLRQSDFYIDCSSSEDEEQHLRLLVLSGAFEQYINQLSAQKGRMIFGLREWYMYWAAPSKEQNELLLMTNRYASIQPTAGNISIRVIQDTLAFVQENLQGGHVLTRENCPREAQDLLFTHALVGHGLEEAILSELNVALFSEIDVMSRWNALGSGQRQLVLLWGKQHPSDSYFSNCIKASSAPEDIPEHILHDIFALYPMHPAWVRESQRLIAAMKLKKDARFFLELDQIPVYEDRLQYLSGDGKEERIYLLRTIGTWMREDANQVLGCKLLEKLYPALHAYLHGECYDSELNRYFTLYKVHKLANLLPADEDLYFSGIRTETYDYRFAALHDAITSDCVVLWIDALGVEWLPLLSWALGQCPDGRISHMLVTQATLPTETCFNEQWKQMEVPHEKLDRLDKLAHKGVVDDPDYYSCVEEQLSFVQDIAERANVLLKSFQRVIITGDHGTSRLAARFFHRREGMLPPPGATVYCHGRYCKLEAATEALTSQLVTKDRDGNQYLVFSNYDHYKQQGFAAGADDENAIFGEVHGGATPEELLVPLIVFDSIVERPLTAQWQKTTVKIVAKKARTRLCFSRPVTALQVKLGTCEGKCTASSDLREWSVEFSGIAPDTYSAAVAADGILVDVDPLEILPALGGGVGDLP